MTKKIIITILLIIFFSTSGLYIYIYLNAPEFNRDLLYKKESTNIYDSKGNLIATIGSEKRQIVSYEELPEVLIDAIIATEDSRFFEHNGLDLPRFIKASYYYLIGSNAGGASTLTMQVSKNTYTNNESTGIKGLIRKFTDIYLSKFKIEKNYSKKEIIEFYVNAPYLGSGNYGVAMATKNYFNKDVNDINLVEAATIAGLFQAPSAYDPRINKDEANKRKNEVISLMLRHGYITKEIAESAINTHVENLLSKEIKINP